MMKQQSMYYARFQQWLKYCTATSTNDRIFFQKMGPTNGFLTISNYCQHQHGRVRRIPNQEIQKLTQIMAKVRRLLYGTMD